MRRLHPSTPSGANTLSTAQSSLRGGDTIPMNNGETLLKVRKIDHIELLFDSSSIWPVSYHSTAHRDYSVFTSTQNLGTLRRNLSAPTLLSYVRTWVWYCVKCNSMARMRLWHAECQKKLNPRNPERLSSSVLRTYQV